MAIRIEWDEFEIALLIEACEEVLRKGKPKSEVVKTVSSNLRKRAISNRRCFSQRKWHCASNAKDGLFAYPW